MLAKISFEVDLQSSVLVLLVLNMLDVLLQSASRDVQAVPLTLTAGTSPKCLLE